MAVRPYDPEEEVPLLPIEDYRARVLGSVSVLTPRSVPLGDALGCVLAEDIVALRDLPPFASSAMDGFAVKASDIDRASVEAPVPLHVIGEVRMGTGAEVTLDRGTAVAVSTGAAVPSSADAVVPVELTAREGDRVLVLRALPAGKHVRPAGEDVRRGDRILPAGRRLSAVDVGALAANGCADVRVTPRARVAVLATGDELVRPGAELAPGQIYDSNTYSLVAAVREAGGDPVDVGVVSDDPEILIATLDAVRDDVDAFVCSGGVSMGERDPVKRAFSSGGDVSFANVGMQPGRPQAFGSWRGKPLFGLPGNPVSVFVSFEVFVRPALQKMMGRSDDRRIIVARLDGTLDAPRTRTRFARVRVSREGDGYVASPEGGHQSNLLVTFARADGLAEVPAGTTIDAGGECRVILLRDV